MGKLRLILAFVLFFSFPAHSSTITLHTPQGEFFVDLTVLPQVQYETFYNHPIINPLRRKEVFQGVLIEDILKKFNSPLDRAKAIHVFGKDDYLVSLNAFSEIKKFKPMITYAVGTSGKQSNPKLRAAIPLLIYQYDKGMSDEINRNYWCWWVKTIVVESGGGFSKTLEVKFGQTKKVITQREIDSVKSREFQNYSIQKGATRYLARKKRNVVPVRQKSMFAVLKYLFPEAMDFQKMTVKNINGNTFELDLKEFLPNHFFLGFVPSDGFFQQGYPVLLSLLDGKKSVRKNWPYVTEIIFE